MRMDFMLSSFNALFSRNSKVLRVRPRHLLGVAIMTVALQGAVAAYDMNGSQESAVWKVKYLAQATADDDVQNRRQRLKRQFAGAQPGVDEGTGTDAAPQDPMSRRARLKRLMQNGGLGGGSGGGDLMPGMQGPGGGEMDPQTMEARRQMRQRFRQGQGMGMGRGMGMRQGMGQNRFGDRQLFGRRPLDLTPLSLTEDQKEKIKQVRGQTSIKAREIRRVMMAKQGEMRDLMFDPTATDDVIRAKRMELRKLRDQIEEMTINDFLSIRAVLTPEQRKRLPEIKPGMGMGGGRMMPPGGGQGFPPRPPGPGPFNASIPSPDMEPAE